jgi:hypothetical protein
MQMKSKTLTNDSKTDSDVNSSEIASPPSSITNYYTETDRFTGVETSIVKDAFNRDKDRLYSTYTRRKGDSITGTLSFQDTFYGVDINVDAKQLIPRSLEFLIDGEYEKVSVSTKYRSKPYESTLHNMNKHLIQDMANSDKRSDCEIGFDPNKQNISYTSTCELDEELFQRIITAKEIEIRVGGNSGPLPTNLYPLKDLLRIPLVLQLSFYCMYEPNAHKATQLFKELSGEAEKERKKAKLDELEAQGKFTVRSFVRSLLKNSLVFIAILLIVFLEAAYLSNLYIDRASYVYIKLAALITTFVLSVVSVTWLKTRIGPIAAVALMIFITQIWKDL